MLYHGAIPWSAPRTFDALLDIPDGVRPAVVPHLIRFTYLLDDLSEIPDEQLRGRAMTALTKLVSLCFKHARTHADLVEKLSGWADVLREVVKAPHGLEALALVMRYILLVNERIEPEALHALLEREIGAQAKDTIMTAGERLIEQGIQRGIEQGIQQGIQRGKSTALLQLLRQRFGDQVDARAEQRVAAASLDQVDAWFTRVLSAPTLAELFAG